MDGFRARTNRVDDLKKKYIQIHKIMICIEVNWPWGIGTMKIEVKKSKYDLNIYFLCLTESATSKKNRSPFWKKNNRFWLVNFFVLKFSRNLIRGDCVIFHTLLSSCSLCVSVSCTVCARECLPCFCFYFLFCFCFYFYFLFHFNILLCFVVHCFRADRTARAIMSRVPSMRCAWVCHVCARECLVVCFCFWFLFCFCFFIFISLFFYFILIFCFAL